VDEPPIQSGAGGTAATPDSVITPGADQPIEIRLKPDTELHRDVLQKLKARVELSYRNMSSRYDDWDRVDERLRLFVDLSRQARKGDKTIDPTKKEMPFARSIVMPLSYANHQTRKTQIFSLYSKRSPFFEVDGVSPEDITPAFVMEGKLDYDMKASNGLLAIYAMVQDADRYGMGVVYDYWDQQQGWIYGPPPIQGPQFAQYPPQITQMMAQAFPILSQPTQTFGITKEFNRLAPVDPFNVWPDPRVSPSNLQRGEFYGHREYVGFTDLVTRSGGYFNLEKLKEIARGGAGGSRDPVSNRSIGNTRFAVEQFALKETGDKDDKGYYAIDHVQVKLIPKDWKLGPEETPRIWQFEMADERIVVRAKPVDNAHGQFSYSCAEMSPDPHVITNPGPIELLDGYQRTGDWLINSHIDNVRRVINDAMIFSARFIEKDDLLNPGSGRWIRLTAEGEDLVKAGVPIGSFYQQLAVSDITAGHANIYQMLYDAAQRVTATNDPMQGQMMAQDRTLGEIKAVISGSSQILSIAAQMMDATGITPTAYRMISNAQQYTTLEQYIKINGDLMRELDGNMPGMTQGRVQVNKSQLQGNFDYVPHSSMMPSDPGRNPQFWQQALQAFGQFPMLMQPNAEGKVPDISAIFGEGVRQMGIRNLDQFYRLAAPPPSLMPGAPPPPGISVQPDQQVQQQVQAGNYVPAGVQ
jgi:hypothetical protein